MGTEIEVTAPTTLCVYHDDFDGECSAAIVRKFEPTGSVIFHRMNYGDPFPYDKLYLELKENGEPQLARNLIMVDFSLSPKDMFRIAEALEDCGDYTFTWIDHHSKAIQDISETGFLLAKNVSCNLDANNRVAACELAWQYYSAKRGIPIAVQYVGRYDVHDEDAMCDCKSIELFNNGLQAENTDPETGIWSSLLFLSSMNADRHIAKIVESGKAIHRYKFYASRKLRDELIQEKLIRIPYIVKPMMFLVANIPVWKNDFCLPQFDKDRHYGYMIYYTRNDGMVKVSVRTPKRTVRVDELCVAMGGGGHKQAASFITTPEKFTAMLNEIQG